MIDTPRMLVLWVGDWPVVAAGARLDQPVAVVRANRVVAVTPAGRDEGVAVGLRRREAQARCPAVEIVAHDPARDARAFEPVVAAVAERITPRVEVVAPGQVAFPTRGPARYHGGDVALADLVVATAVEVLGVAAGPAVGVADGRFAALLAALGARRADVIPTDPVAPVLVAPGGSAAYLDPLPIEALDLLGIDAGVVEVFRRLGLRTLGALAALSATDLAGRFGVVGATAHRLASGLDGQPPMPGVPPADHTVRIELDPPAEQVETVAFVARGLADDLTGRLGADGLTCTRLLVVAETDHGERHERRWRGDGLGGAGTLTAGAIVDRVRWQLDGWLRTDAPTAGVTLLELAAEEVVAAGGRQLGFWGRSPEADDGAVRAVARVAGLLGLDAVLVPAWRGGRDPAEQLDLVPAAALDLTADRSAVVHRAAAAGSVDAEPARPPVRRAAGPPVAGVGVSGRPGRRLGRADRATDPWGEARAGPAHRSGRRGRVAARRAVVADATPPWPWVPSGHAPAGSVGVVDPAPWPGAPPVPAPAALVETPVGAELVDAAGRSVRVGGEGAFSAPPARLRRAGEAWVEVVAWAGPWTIEERWWDLARRRRRAHLQLLDAAGTAVLLTVEAGRWWVVAVYD